MNNDTDWEHNHINNIIINNNNYGIAKDIIIQKYMLTIAVINRNVFLGFIDCAKELKTSPNKNILRDDNVYVRRKRNKEYIDTESIINDNRITNEKENTFDTNKTFHIK